MRNYILRRLIWAIPTLFLMTLILFLLVNWLPGDVVEGQLAGSGLPREEIDAYKHELGLDRSVLVQYFDWLGGVFTLDFGESVLSKRSVVAELEQRAPATLHLGILGLALAMLIAIPLGTISAIRPNSPIDYIARFFAIGGLSVPNFVVGVLLILLTSKYLGYFPGVGFVRIWDDPIKSLELMWMPVLVMGLVGSAPVARMIRSTLLEVLHSDYIRTAWAKGLRERAVVTRHAIKNSLIPVITIIGLQARTIIGGLVIIEVLFTIPGMGQLLVTSVGTRDLVPLQSVVLIFAATTIVINLLVDISYSWLDPRIRQG
jgi:peptide/nickel transport system permease protein